MVAGGCGPHPPPRQLCRPPNSSAIGGVAAAAAAGKAHHVQYTHTATDPLVVNMQIYLGPQFAYPIPDTQTPFAVLEEEKGYSVGASAAIVSVCSIVILVTVVGNLSVLVAFCREKRLRTASNYPLISLSLNDLLVGTLIFPCSVVFKVTGNWYFGRVLCVVWMCCDYMATSTSVFSLILITFDRYLTIAKFHKYKHDGRHVLCWIIVAWSIPAVVFIPITILWPIIDPTFVVQPLTCEEGWLGFKWFTVPVTCFFTYCPLLLLIFFNAKIYLVIRENARQMERSESKAGGGHHGGDDGGAYHEQEPPPYRLRSKARQVVLAMRLSRGRAPDHGGLEEPSTAPVANGTALGLPAPNNPAPKRGGEDEEEEEDEDDEEECVVLEKQLQKKQQQLRNTQRGRKAGPQNRRHLWHRLLPSRQPPEVQSEVVVVSHHPVVFSTRAASPLLDAVAAREHISYKSQQAQQQQAPPDGHRYSAGAGEHTGGSSSTAPEEPPPPSPASNLDRLVRGLHTPDSLPETPHLKPSRAGGGGGRLRGNKLCPPPTPAAAPPVGSPRRLPPSSSSSATTEGGGGGGPHQVSEQTRARQLRRQQRNMTIFKLIIVLVCVYVCCWVPFSIITFIDNATPYTVPDVYWDISVWILYSNSSVNPLLYVYRNMAFRDAILRLYRLKPSPPAA